MQGLRTSAQLLQTRTTLYFYQRGPCNHCVCAARRLDLRTRLAGNDGGKEHCNRDVSGEGAAVLEGERNRLLGDGVEEGEGVFVWYERFNAAVSQANQHYVRLRGRLGPTEDPQCAQTGDVSRCRLHVTSRCSGGSASVKPMAAPSCHHQPQWLLSYAFLIFTLTPRPCTPLSLRIRSFTRAYHLCTCFLTALRALARVSRLRTSFRAPRPSVLLPNLRTRSNITFENPQWRASTPGQPVQSHQPA